MLQTILLVAMIIISIALTAVVLLQRSEGGALGMGGGPSGFMTARGAGNLLTKTTWVLAVLFFLCAIGLTILGNVERSSRSIVDADAIGELAKAYPGSGIFYGQQLTRLHQPLQAHCCPHLVVNRIKIYMSAGK